MNGELFLSGKKVKSLSSFTRNNNLIFQEENIYVCMFADDHSIVVYDENGECRTMDKNDFEFI